MSDLGDGGRGDEGHQAGCRRAKAPEFESDEVLRQAPVDNSAIVADELDSSQAGVKQEDSAAQYEPEAENTLPRKCAGMIARLHGLLACVAANDAPARVSSAHAAILSSNTASPGSDHHRRPSGPLRPQSCPPCLTWKHPVKTEKKQSGKKIRRNKATVLDPLDLNRRLLDILDGKTVSLFWSDGRRVGRYYLDDGTYIDVGAADEAEADAALDSIVLEEVSVKDSKEEVLRPQEEGTGSRERADSQEREEDDEQSVSDNGSFFTAETGDENDTYQNGMDETVLSSENFGENGAGEDLEDDETSFETVTGDDCESDEEAGASWYELE